MFLSSVATAADFGFSVIIRAGSTAASDWEIGIGPRGSTPTSTVSLNPYYQDNTAQQFQVGYQQSTNTAYVRFYQNAGSFQQATYQPAGGHVLPPYGSWTLPASSFSVAAAPVFWQTSVAVNQLALSSGLSIVQPLSATSLSASQWLWGIIGTPSAALASPVVFRSFGSGGDWMLSGTIAFGGLSAYGGSASGTQLRFGFDANASDVPEPSTALFFGCGLGLIGVCFIRRRSSQPQEIRKRPE
jgi:hypothetical protein